MKFYKPMMAAVCVLWVSLMFHIIALEFIGFLVDDLIVTGVITISLLLLFYVYYFYLYFKNAKKVKKLKEEYLDSLKPTKPLLFCPTDEELVRKFNEENLSKKHYASKEQTKEPIEDTIEEEISM